MQQEVPPIKNNEQALKNWIGQITLPSIKMWQTPTAKKKVLDETIPV